MLPSYQSIQASNAATRSIAGNVSSRARSMPAVPIRRMPGVEGADNTNVPVQAKFTVEGKEYKKENKNEIDDVEKLQNLLAGYEQKESIISIIRSYAAESDDKGQMTWSSLIWEVSKQMKKDVKQFELASQQIISQYPMKEWAYVGLGGSPDPIAYDLMRHQGDPVVLFLPMSNIDAHNLKGILEYMHVESESAMVKKYNSDNETKHKGRQDFIDNEGGEEYMNKIRAPFLSANLIRKHLDSFVPTDKLKGRTNVLLMDYVASGHSLLYASSILQTYYGDKIKVQPFAFGVPVSVKKSEFQYLKEEGGVKPAHLANIFGNTTYKEGHRIYSKFDVADLFKKIKELGKGKKLGQIMDLKKIPNIDVEEVYQKPKVDKEVLANLGNLYKVADEENIDLASLTLDQGAELLDKLVKKYRSDVDILYEAVTNFDIYKHEPRK